MFLRDHPLMMYNGVRSWPPRWLRRAGNDTTNLRGEVGILKDVIPSFISPYDRCFLVMEYRGAEYIGALLLNDRAFCNQVVELLKAHCNRSVAEIGGLDVSLHFVEDFK